jgi:hypothetical protein
MSMNNGNGRPDFVARREPLDFSAARIERLHSSWLAFIHYCAELQHGEIERLKIQDGLPVLAEVTRKKVKFAL